MATRPPRLFISVRPKVFGDALSRVLSRGNVDVALHSKQTPLTETHYDLAIVSEPSVGNVSADVVISIPEDPDDAAPTLTDLIRRVERAASQLA